MDPFFIHSNLTGKLYHEMFVNEMISAIQSLFGCVVVTQDGVPLHCQVQVHELLDESFLAAKLFEEVQLSSHPDLQICLHLIISFGDS